jgi:hypothetical protein
MGISTKSQIPPWLLAKAVCVVAVILLLAACSELFGPSLRVDQRFATYQEAVAAGALHEGSFIPPFIPKSATNNHDVHNADINTGHGSFEFHVDDAEDFKQSIVNNELPEAELEKLADLPARQEKAYRRGYYLLFVDWKVGECRWRLEWLGLQTPLNSL